MRQFCLNPMKFFCSPHSLCLSVVNIVSPQPPQSPPSHTKIINSFNHNNDFLIQSELCPRSKAFYHLINPETNKQQLQQQQQQQQQKSFLLALHYCFKQEKILRFFLLPVLNEFESEKTNEWKRRMHSPTFPRALNILKTVGIR